MEKLFAKCAPRLLKSKEKYLSQMKNFTPKKTVILRSPASNDCQLFAG